jgi:hypothetical protein
MRLYFLYDARACGGVGTDDATVLTCGESLEEVREDAKDYGGGAIYSYSNSADGSMRDEKWEEDV